MSEESINIHARDQKFRVGVFSPSNWATGMSRPSMVVELYPVFHRESVSFEASIAEMPEVVDGCNAQYIAEKVMNAIRMELEDEGTIPSEVRKKDGTWILSRTGGFIRNGIDYNAVVWFSSDDENEAVTEIWVAAAESVGRKTVSVDEPKGHCFKV